MNICYFNFSSISSFFFPTLLDDAIINIRDLDNKATFVYCDGTLPSCDANPTHSEIICRECIYLTKSKLKKFNKTTLSVAKISSFIDDQVKSEIMRMDFKYESLDDIKKISYNDMSIGMGIVSSFVSKTRNLHPYLDQDIRSVINNQLRSACLITEAVLKVYKNTGIDQIKFCNGRLTSERAVFEAANKFNIDHYVIELTSSTIPYNFRKVEFHRSLPHDIEANTILINEYWKSNIENRNKADTFYEKRRLGEYASDKVYINNQKKGLLPDNWNAAKRNFVIFNSSEDEFYSIGGTWDNYKLFENQYLSILHLLECTKDDDTIHYFLRIHPNLKNVKYKYAMDLLNGFSNYNNITVIAADSPISTYDLIDNAEKCIVFSSSVGAESTYYNKPVILLGGCMYIHLNVGYYPENIDEIKTLLVKKLKPKPKLGSLKYAFFLHGGRGEKFKYVNFNANVLSILGKKIFINKYLSVGNMIMRVLYRVLRVKDRKKILQINRKLYIEKT